MMKYQISRRRWLSYKTSAVLAYFVGAAALLGCGDAASPGAQDGPGASALSMEKKAVEDARWWVKSELLYTTIAAAGTDGTIYFGAWDGRLYAVAPDGTQKWTVQTGDKINAAPAVASDGTIVFGSWDKKVYAIHPDGSPKWSFEADALVDVSPSIDAQGRVLVASDHGTLYRLSAAGALEDEVSLPSPATTAVSIYEDAGVLSYYIGGADDAVYCLSEQQLKDGEFSRSEPLKGHPVDDIALDAGGFGYFGTTGGHAAKVDRDCTILFSEGLTWAPVSAPALGADGDIYVGMLSDEIARLKGADGSPVWRESTPWHAPLLAAPTLSSDGRFYAGANGLISFDTRGKITEHSRLDILTSPLLYAGAVYATTESGLFVRLELDLGEVGASDWPIQHGNVQRTGYLKP